MTAKRWKKKIIEEQKAVDVYRKSFDTVIDALATILEQRDAVFEKFVAEGCQFTVIKTQDRGAQNMAVNPVFKLWQDLNTQALNYWKELGLTAKSLKAITDDTTKTKLTVSDMLQGIGNE